MNSWFSKLSALVIRLLRLVDLPFGGFLTLVLKMKNQIPYVICGAIVASKSQMLRFLNKRLSRTDNLKSRVNFLVLTSFAWFNINALYSFPSGCYTVELLC